VVTTSAAGIASMVTASDYLLHAVPGYVISGG